MMFKSSDANATTAHLSNKLVFIWRALFGLLQGFMVYQLEHALRNAQWPHQHPYLFILLAVFAILGIPSLHISIPHFNRLRVALTWSCALLLYFLLIVFYDYWRHIDPYLPSGSKTQLHDLSPWFCFSLFISLFISLSIFKAKVESDVSGLCTTTASGQGLGREEQLNSSRGSIAGSKFSRVLGYVKVFVKQTRYEAYFEESWKLIIQLGFATGFLLFIWGTFALGAALLALIKLTFLREALENHRTLFLLHGLSFAMGIHLTDVKPKLIAGLRNLLLNLLSWALPISVVLTAIFLLSLPFTGLESLWKTRLSSQVLLSSAGVLILLINATYQNGLHIEQRHFILRGLLSIGACLILPLVLISIFSLSIRVNEYGWTSNRIFVAITQALLLIYGIGYLYSTLKSRVDLRYIASTNLIAAYAIVALLIATNSPLLDPTKISTQSQLQLFQHGKVSASEFDVQQFIRGKTRFEKHALHELENYTGKDSEVIKANLIAARKNTYCINDCLQATVPTTLVSENFKLVGASPLPDSFLKRENFRELMPHEIPTCFYKIKSGCTVTMIALSESKPPLIVVAETISSTDRLFVFELTAMGKWQILPNEILRNDPCKGLVEELNAQKVKLVSPQYHDLGIGNHVIRIRPHADSKGECN